MLRKKLRESLTARIFLLTLGILLAASGITFGLIAWATPMTYVSVLSDELRAQADQLSNSLIGQPYESALNLISDFAARTSAELTLASPEGDLISVSFETMEEMHSNDQAAPAESEQATALVITEATVAVASGTATESAPVEDYAGTYDSLQENISYTLSFPIPEKGIYTLLITPSTQPINQAVEALAKVAPWLLCVMLLFSLLCAYGYSRYISRPIVHLSGISQKMAALDFGWEYSENRSDEIGKLGCNLNSLSRSLTLALGDLREANAALQRDIELERELEQQRLAFFSAASHELKTPLTILKGQLTGMLEGVDVYRDRDKYLVRSLQVTGRMERLVQELLTISRMEAADFVAQMQPLDLALLLGEQLPLYLELAQQKNLTIESDMQENLPLTGDEKLLRRAVDSILSNALLYSSSGETVRVTAELQAGETVLTVENSGTAIPKESLPHLFEAFYRVEQSRNRSTGGSGLGLYLTARILARHHAAYTVENTAVGVRFTIRFPRAEIST